MKMSWEVKESMKNITKITTIGLPAAIDLGHLWVGVWIICKERKLAAREMEQRLQLEAKAIKDL